MLYSKLVTAILFVATATCAYAQEYNIGIHINPILVTPLLDEYSNTSALRVSPLRLNIGAGFNFNIRANKWNIETGANGLFKSVQANYKTSYFGQSTVNKSVFKATGYNTSVEIPLQVGYLLHHHEQKTTYDVFGFAGVSYEVNLSQGYATSGYSYGNSNSPSSTGSLFFDDTKPRAGKVTSWANLIGGFKINAILRKVGLIDYGISFHYPLQNAGEHSIRAVVSSGNLQEEASVFFSPRLAYTDIKLCYYFLNLDKHLKRKTYRFE